MGRDYVDDDGLMYGYSVWNKLGPHVGNMRYIEDFNERMIDEGRVWAGAHGSSGAVGVDEKTKTPVLSEARVIPVDVDFKKLLVIDGEFGILEANYGKDALNETTDEFGAPVPAIEDVVMDGAAAKVFRKAFAIKDSTKAADVLRKGLVELGYDGIEYINAPEIGGSSYVALVPNTIKFALSGQYMQEAGDQARGLTIGPDKKINIGLLEKADLSTFLHESGHVYLEIIRDLSSVSGWEKVKQFVGQELEDGPQRAQLREDAEKIAKWLGTENLDNLSASSSETRL